jgi:hypothetical protein
METDMIRTMLVAAALVCVTLPAVAQPYRDRDMREPPCLRNRNIYDYQLVPGNRSLVVRDIARNRYRINFMGRCYDLQHNFGLAFRTRGVGSLACVTRGDSVYNNQAIGAGRQCIVQSVEYQTRDLDRMDREAMQIRDERRRDRDYRDDYRDRDYRGR